MSMHKTLVAAAVAAFAVLGTAGTASASSGAGAVGGASDSPGVLSGNVIQVPINLPFNLCGNDIPLLSALTGAAGNTCAS
jgi:small secreted domain DUF320